MSYNPLQGWFSRTAFILAAMTGPLAYAAPSPPEAIGALQLGGGQLSTQQLSTIRGGFDISPTMSISFGFQQIDYAGTQIIQSIMVPMTTLIQGATSAPVYVTSGGTTTLQPTGTSGVTVTSTANNGQTIVTSQLNNSGITNVISNQANNALLSQVTTMNIGITGMTQWLSQQQSAATLTHGLTFGQGAFH